MSRKKRRTFTDTQKVDAVRRHLKDRVPVSEIANELDVQPTMIHNWVNAVLQRAEQGQPADQRHRARVQLGMVAEMEARSDEMAIPARPI